MSDKSVILKNIDGDRIFPIIPYTNIVGAPHPLNGDVTIFYGTGVPVTTKSTYENIKEDDLYIDRSNTYGLGIYICAIVSDTTVTWRSLSNGVYYPGDPTTSITSWYSRTPIDPNIGLIYVNSNTGDIFILTGKERQNLTWTKITGGSGNLPPSSSSDAGKVLTVDQNGDPDWENVDGKIWKGTDVDLETRITITSEFEGIKEGSIFVNKISMGGYFINQLCIVKEVGIRPVSSFFVLSKIDLNMFRIESTNPPATVEDYNYIEIENGVIWINSITQQAYIKVGEEGGMPEVDYFWKPITLPSSISSDAGKVLMVDKNGDPNWFRKDWEIIGVASKGTEGTSTLLDFNDIQIPTNHDYKAFRITYYVNASSSGTVEIKLNGQSGSSFWFGGNSTVSGKKFTEIIIEDHNLPNIDGTGSNYYATATINRCNTYNYGQRTNFLATSQNNIARPQNITSIRLDIGASWTFDHDSARVILEGKR